MCPVILERIWLPIIFILKLRVVFFEYVYAIQPVTDPFGL